MFLLLSEKLVFALNFAVSIACHRQSIFQCGRGHFPQFYTTLIPKLEKRSVLIFNKLIMFAWSDDLPKFLAIACMVAFPQLGEMWRLALLLCQSCLLAFLSLQPDRIESRISTQTSSNDAVWSENIYVVVGMLLHNILGSFSKLKYIGP